MRDKTSGKRTHRPGQRRACVGWCVHIPELLSRLVSQLVSHVSPMCACGGCARLSEVLSRLVSLCWMLSPCSPGLAPLCVPSYFPILDGVSAFLKPCLPSYFPLLDGASAFPRSVLPCPPLFPIVFPHVCPTCVLCCVTAFPTLFFLHMCACVGWCVRLPEVLPPLVSHSLPFCLCLDGMTHCLPLSSLHMCLRWISEVLPPLVSHCLPTSAPKRRAHHPQARMWGDND